MNRIKKNIKQYSEKLDQPTMMALDNNCIQYGNTYNYFTSRYSGINSSAITVSQTSTRKNCRDVLVKVCIGYGFGASYIFGRLYEFRKYEVDVEIDQTLLLRGKSADEPDQKEHQAIFQKTGTANYDGVG